VHAARLQIATDQRGRVVHARPGDIGYQASRRATRKFYKADRDLPGIDRLEPEPGRDKDHPAAWTSAARP